MSIVIGNKTVAGIHIANKEVQRMTIGGKTAYEKGPKYLTIENEYAGSNTISLEAHGTLDPISLDYSTDNGSTWTTWSSANGNLSVTLAQGEKVMFKGDNNYFSKDDNNTYRFHATANCNASGNIMSLVDSTCTSLVIPSAYCFDKLFRGNTYIDINGLVLPATTLTQGCYRGMFLQASRISHTPELPATTMAAECYQNMFQETSITVAPVLSSTSLADSCYRYMLASTPITAAPALPATTLAANCYFGMFQYCGQLTTMPELPATTLAENCYRDMFLSAGLTSATGMLATSMTTNSLYRMFYNCFSLNRIDTYITNWDSNNSPNWVSGVASTGDFYNLGGATIPSGASGIPSGWTEHTTL